MRQYLHRQVLQSQFPDVRKLVELVLGLPVMNRGGRGQVNHSGKHGNIECRHLLAAHDNATVHGRALNLFPTIHIHTCASYAVVGTLDDFNDSHI